MKIIIIIIISFFYCISCTGKDEKKEYHEIEKIKIDLKKIYKEKKFPDINQSMTIQKLEDNEKHPVGYIDKLIINKEYIYILDRDKAKSIFIYNRNGKLLHVIDNTGMGPGEFSYPQDFDIDNNSKNIIIMDAGSSKLIFYSSKGEYIKEVKYNFFANRFILDNKKNIIMDTGNIPSKGESYYLNKIDMNGNLLSSFFPTNPSTRGITFNPRNPFQKCDNKLFYLPTLSKNIYTLENENPILTYQIDFGKDWPSEEFCESVKDMHPLRIREMMFKKNYICFLNCIQTKDVLHIDFYKEKKYYSFYYNKLTKKSILIPMEDENISLPLATFEDEFIFVNYSKKTGEPILVFYTVDFDLCL